MPDKSYMQFKRVSNSNTDLFIYGDIRKPGLFEKWFGDSGDGRTDALSFAEALNEVDTPNLTVHINSYGGSVSEGLAIYSLLSDFKGNLITVVDGFACSAASVIFMAGKERIVPESGLLLIHNAWTQAEGDSNALKKAAEDLEKITQPSIDIYCSKTRLSESKIKELMDEETWITSKEAYELGFSTVIKRNEAMQSLESGYMLKLIEKIRDLSQKIKQYQIEKNESSSKMDENSAPKSMEAFFKN